ncbi:hypothetical protein D3C72_977610 [compost metagenome]
MRSQLGHHGVAPGHGHVGLADRGLVRLAVAGNRQRPGDRERHRGALMANRHRRRGHRGRRRRGHRGLEGHVGHAAVALLLEHLVLVVAPAPDARALTHGAAGRGHRGHPGPGRLVGVKPPGLDDGRAAALGGLGGGELEPHVLPVFAGGLRDHAVIAPFQPVTGRREPRVVGRRPARAAHHVIEREGHLTGCRQLDGHRHLAGLLHAHRAQVPELGLELLPLTRHRAQVLLERQHAAGLGLLARLEEAQ